MALFGRTYVIRVGPPLGIPFTPGLLSAPGFGREWSGSVDGDGLQMTFEVERKGSRKGDTAEIQLYNLDSSSIGFLEQPGLKITISAGYEGNNALLFIGDISKKGVSTEKPNEDRITTIEAGSGELIITETRFDVAFTEGTTAGVIIQALAAAMGVASNIQESPELSSIPYLTGFAHFGLAREALDEICGQIGAQWSLQNGSLVILKPGQPRLTTGALLSSATGLLGSPVREKKGISGVSLLNPAIVPGDPLAMVSLTASGLFKCTSCVHSGDYRGGTWQTAFKAREINL